MESVFQAAVVYLFLLVVLRVAGKRTLSEMTTFDFVLLLIIGETVQQAVIGNDFSMINAVVLIVTLILIDIILSILKQRSIKLECIIDGAPLLIMEDGKLLERPARMSRVDEEDILYAARQTQGIHDLQQVRYAVVERNGKISIIPKEG